MQLRTLGLRTQELAAGPYRFLLSDSIPVAYTDGDHWYVTEQYHNKATTKRINRWLYSHDKPATNKRSQKEIGALFEGLDRYTLDEAVDRRQGGRRELDQVPESTRDLAMALARVLANGKR
jgi:hypothetical protein